MNWIAGDFVRAHSLACGDVVKIYRSYIDRRYVSAFIRNYSTRNTSETTFPEDFILEEQEKVSFEEEGS